MDENQCVIAIFFDLSMAFDNISFSFLTTQAAKLGFPTYFINWLYSYMEGRCLKVQCNNTTSNNYMVILGIPQGSVHGTILFIVY